MGIRRWFKHRAACKEHQRLLDEARRDWAVVATHKQHCVWGDCGNRSAGYYVYTMEENGIGERRVRIVGRPNYPWPHQNPGSEHFAKCLEWAAKAERKSIPIREIA